MQQPRKVRHGNHGLDVRAYKRALRRAGHFHGRRTRGRYGARMEHAVHEFQLAHGLRGTGRIGHNTYILLRPHIDGFGRLLLRTYSLRRRKLARQQQHERQRLEMHTAMQWGLQNERDIHYPVHDIRTEPNHVPIDRWHERRLPVTLDCSQAAVAIAKAGGAGDPTGSNWGKSSRAMFTGTMLSTCRPIPEHALDVGDYAIFGPATGDHVSVVYEAGRDPLMWSHGFDGGPLLIRLSQQRGQHRAPVRCLAAPLDR